MTKFDKKLFISEIQKRPSIWDTTSEQNADKELKSKDWDEVINIFGEKDMSLSDRNLLALTLQKRWKNLRTCFVRELKRKKNYGAGIGRRSEYMYYKSLSFLKDVVNITEKEINEPEYVYYEKNERTLSQSNFDSSSKRKRKMPDEESHSGSEEDEDRLFLLSLHKTLKRVPTKKKLSVKIKMLSVLNQATEG